LNAATSADPAPPTTAVTTSVPPPAPAATADGQREKEEKRAKARKAMAPAAYALLVTGAVGLAVNVYLLASDQPLFRVVIPTGGRSDRGPGITMEWPGRTQWTVSLAYIFLVVNAVIMAGAWHMRLGRRYWLAVLGSLFAMANINSLFCLLSYGIGAWSLLTLRKAEVRQAFD
jgi:hypothetical protein